MNKDTKNDTIKYLEDYVKFALKIPYCNFSEIHPKIAYEIIVGLSLMYEKYPFFDRIICSITQNEDLESHINTLEYSDKKFKASEYINIKRDGTYTFCEYYNNNLITPTKFDKNNISYFSFLITDKTKNVNPTEIKDLYTSIYGRAAIYHEFGHLLDTFLKISTNDKFLNLIKNHDIEKEISNYACVNNRELVAEAFKLYILATKNLTNLEVRLGKVDFMITKYNVSPLVIQIGQLIDEEYKKFVKFRQIKFINKKYNINERFTIRKKSKPIDIEKLEERIKNSKI